MYAVLLVTSVLIAGGLVDAYDEEKLINARIQSLERALIMKLIQNEFAQTQVVACNPEWKGKNYFLMKDQVASFVNPKSKRTYIYVPHEYTGKNYDNNELFVKSTGEQAGEQHAEDIMFKELKGVPPREYWINNSPCPRCALNLIARYDAAKIPEPRTMNFMHFYTLPTRYFPGLTEPEAKKKSRQLSLECMAKMMQNGWQFESWDLGYFNDHYLTDKQCKDALKEALNKLSDAIKEELNEANEAIQEVKRIAQTTPEQQLCQNVPN